MFLFFIALKSQRKERDREREKEREIIYTYYTSLKFNISLILSLPFKVLTKLLSILFV